MSDDDKKPTTPSPDDRWTWNPGELSVEDPETGETKRIGDVPEKYRDAPS